MPSGQPARRRRYKSAFGELEVFVSSEPVSLDIEAAAVETEVEAASGVDGFARSLRTDSFSMGSLFILRTIIPTKIRAIIAMVARIVI